MKMKKIPAALLFICSWTLSYAQSSSSLNTNNASITTAAQISTSGINVTVATTVSASLAAKNSNVVIFTSGANFSNTSSNITPANKTNLTVSSVSATTTPNITSTAPVILPVSTRAEKLVVTKTITPIFHRPETPKPDAIVNLYKSSRPQHAKTSPVQTFSLASAHSQESIVQLSNKVSLVIASEGLGADASNASTAQLVDAIASPHSLQNEQLMLSMLKK